MTGRDRDSVRRPRHGMVRLVCWSEELAAERAKSLKGSAFRVDASRLNPGRLIGEFKAAMPSAVLIDLDKLPSHGREVAVALRNSPTTRHLPIVFAGGVREKIERVQKELPDAVFTSWDTVETALETALANVPENPVRPPAHMERYQGSPLVRKLDIKASTRVALIGAPDGFMELLGDLPEDVSVQKKPAGADVVLYFARSRADLEMLPFTRALWVIHPKQSSRYKVDFNQNDVRAAGLASGLVDYKVCSVNDDWSGLKFAPKKT